MTCGVGKNADFWLITKSIPLGIQLAEEIHVDVEAELTECDEPVSGDNKKTPCSSNYFQVYVHYGQHQNAFDSPRLSIYNITNHTWPNSTFSRSNQIFFFPQNNSQYVTFLIQSRGACGRIFRMKIYYYFCDETFYRGIKFEKTRSASFSNGLQNVTASCSNNSKPLKNATNFNGYCYPNGTWQFPTDDDFECVCMKGYTPNDKGACTSKLHLYIDLYDVIEKNFQHQMLYSARSFFLS